MAVRYSGNATVYITWSDRLNAYQVTISVGGKHVWTAKISPPAVLKHAVDSPEAYDETSRSVLHFADSQAEEERSDPFITPARDSTGKVEVARTKEANTIERA